MTNLWRQANEESRTRRVPLAAIAGTSVSRIIPNFRDGVTSLSGLENEDPYLNELINRARTDRARTDRAWEMVNELVERGRERVERERLERG